ncbi:nitroreductase family protein [Dichotomicrobium thermohalophilum]|uniref:Putative NAD(P)H nitroreductase n=1 Tax=Dichotomicrobium thermohalophilum TaxID=933063 RepID=A0A397Q150_9HYPH|nr:nitroreductase [Dichotomicrobium thermohalophilum]RIA55126.1 nitroreductase [Dichotomicrobium thermohalophilum]
MTNPVIDHLGSRRSVKADNLTDPGPDQQQLETILRIASRVPDHKKLTPWRFIVIAGSERAALGERLAHITAENEPEASDVRLEIERNRFLRSPVTIAVVSHTIYHPAVPEWEQILSAGAACMNLVHAAHALGFAAHWLTEWYTYDESARHAVGLNPKERIAGFIHIGTAKEPPQERDRPDLDTIVSYYDSTAQ